MPRFVVIVQETIDYAVDVIAESEEAAKAWVEEKIEEGEELELVERDSSAPEVVDVHRRA